MKKILITALFSLALIALVAPVSVNGQASGSANAPINQSSGSANAPQSPAPTRTFTLQNPLSGIGVDSVGALVQKGVEIFSYLAIIVGVLVLIYIGFRYIMAAAQGNESEISKMHSWLLWAVIGIAIVLAARLMVNVIINTLEATGVNPNVIQNARQAANGQ